ncbi:uncharacterized protein TRIADDRAFT_22330, partial [Trichoplax adhaerens]
LFRWLYPLFKIVRKRQLQESDLFTTLHDDQCRVLLKLFNKSWKNTKVKSAQRTSLFKVFCKCFGPRYLFMGIILFTDMALIVIQPLFIGWLIAYFIPDSNVTRTQAYLYALGLSLTTLISINCEPWYFFMAGRYGIRSGVLLSSAVFQKALKLSARAMAKTSVGHIVNLLANDALQLKSRFYFLHLLWISPLLIITLSVLLWQQVGVACFAGLGAQIFILVQQSISASFLVKFRQKYLKFADERVRIMNEIIAGMRTIKMYAWEKSFANIIKILRRNETKNVSSGQALLGLNQASYLLINTITSFTTITIYVLLGNSIDSAKVFTVYSILNALQIPMSIGIPQAIQAITDAKVTFKRIEEHLLLDELDENIGYNRILTSENGGEVIAEKVSAAWSNGFNLQEISFTINCSKLYALIGPVGCGKTSILMALLGELPLSTGTIRIQGKIGYASQQPWVFSGTVKDNILFGSEYKEDKYIKVLEACALTKDLQSLPHNDLTYVGERGVRLSGGQKARISLARAAYCDADIYIMDDPLSAVDVDVAQHLFTKCICGLLKDRIRILVTHQIQVLDKVDHIVAVQEGRVTHSGPLTQLMAEGVDFTELLQNNDKGNRHELNKSKYDDNEDTALSEERRDEGKISYKTYIMFLSSGNGVIVFALFLLISLISQGSIVVTDWWLSRWSDSFTNSMSNGNNSSNIHVLDRRSAFGLTNRMTIIIYSCLLLVTWILTATRCIATVKIAIDSAINFHNRMLNSILAAPIYFFDTNPVGRVLNRFSKDLSQVDEDLPTTTANVVQIGIYCCGIIVPTAIFNPWVLIPAAIIMIIFVIIRKYYVSLSREVTRLEAVASSPIYGHISSTLHGLTTIRAFNLQDRFMEQFMIYQDNHTRPAVINIALTRWCGYHLDILSGLYLIFVAFIGIFSANDVSAGGIGLSLSYTILLLGNFQWFIRQSAELENQMTSVERIKEYIEVSSETTITKITSPKDWPDKGKIYFENVSFRHHDNLPYVLHNINCIINGGEKVGIVGRTGAGKSSLVAALFRMADITGDIKIDEISTENIRLDILRSNISVIPQDPSLFIGTVRSNLDPFSLYDDSQLWNALNEVQLSDYVSNLSRKLDNEVLESGSNFSVGQKQLLCLARAILKNNKILVIDEATANVDFNTDRIIQVSIRSKFRHCTVITIAHRLNTIIDCDRIMVFKDGRLVEFNSPFVLLRDKNSAFANMVCKSGWKEYERLLDIARRANDSENASCQSNSRTRMLLPSIVTDVDEIQTKVLSYRSNKSQSTDV